MKSRIAIPNATPLISLAILNRLDLLESIFSSVAIPKCVAEEVCKPGKPFSQELSEFVVGRIHACGNRDLLELFAFHLDPGESEALALYYEIKNAVVLIDEEKARKLALRKKIPFLGTLGLLVLAKRKGLVPKVRPLMDSLLANGIRIGKKVYEKVLFMAGEE